MRRPGVQDTAAAPDGGQIGAARAGGVSRQPRAPRRTAAACKELRTASQGPRRPGMHRNFATADLYLPEPGRRRSLSLCTKPPADLHTSGDSTARPASRIAVAGRTRPKRKERSVKLVIGIVRPEKANDVLEALYRCEVRGASHVARAGPRRRARPRRDLPRHAREDGPLGQGAVRDRGLRRVRRPDDRGALRGRPHRRGRRRQDLRRPARARRAHPHGRDRPRRRDAGGAHDAGDRHGRYRVDADRHSAGDPDDAGARRSSTRASSARRTR